MHASFDLNSEAIYSGPTDLVQLLSPDPHDPPSAVVEVESDNLALTVRLTLPHDVAWAVHLPLSRAEARTLAAALLNAADAATG